MVDSGARLGIYLLRSGRMQVLNSDARCGFSNATFGVRLEIYLLHTGEIQVSNSEARCGFSVSDFKQVDSDATFRRYNQVRFRC